MLLSRGLGGRAWSLLFGMWPPGGSVCVVGWGMLLALSRSHNGIATVIVCRPLFDMLASPVHLPQACARSHFCCAAWCQFLQVMFLLVCSLLMVSCTGLSRCACRLPSYYKPPHRMQEGSGQRANAGSYIAEKAWGEGVFGLPAATPECSAYLNGRCWKPLDVPAGWTDRA